MNKGVHLTSSLIFLLLPVLFACQPKFEEKQENTRLTTSDIEQIREINRNYTQGWLENDSKKVIGLYTDSAIIIPSGMNPIVGKRAITEFWFPNDSSSTIIHYYDLEILKIEGSGDHAYSYENGKLSFSYEKGDFKMDREAESYAITIYMKIRAGQWKIIKRIWTDLN